MIRNEFLPFTALTEEEQQHIYTSLNLTPDEVFRCKRDWGANKDTLYNPFTMQKIIQTSFRFGTTSVYELKEKSNQIRYIDFDNKYECLVHANTLEHNGIPYSAVVKENGTGQITIAFQDYPKYRKLIDNNLLSYLAKALGRASRKTVVEEGYHAIRGIPFDKAIVLCKKLSQDKIRYRLEIKTDGVCILYFPSDAKEHIKTLLSHKKATKQISL